MKSYLGIDIGGTNVKIAVVGHSGRIRARGVIDTNPSEGPRKTFRRIEAAAKAMTFGIGVTGVGVGCAGLIDPVRGRLYSSPNLPGWENTPLKRIAERAFGVYTLVDNDANSAAYGEFQLGASRGARHMVFVTLGTGVGGGVIVDGELLRGQANFAAELGHTTIDPNGPRCRCGNRGCLEAYVGSYGLVRSARDMLRRKNSRVLRRWVEEKKRLTPQVIFDAARRGDAAATAVTKMAGQQLGVSIASLVNIFNPKVVVLGGGVAGSFDILLPHIERTVRRRAFPESARMVQIVHSVLGNDATTAGAAMLARDALKKRKRA